MKRNTNRIDPAEVGLRLEAVRTAIGMEKRAFADIIGVDPSTYSKIIRGKAGLRADNAYLIAEKFGVPMDYIYRGRLTDLPESLANALRTI